MKKITFREVRPDWIDYSILYDDEGITNNSGKNNALYIIAGRDYCPVNKKEYRDIVNRAEEIAGYFNDMAEGYNTYFRNYKHILEYYGIKYSPAAVKKFKTWAANFEGDEEQIAEYLTLTTGEIWETYGATGYSQGDYATGIYCKGHYTEETLELYVGAAAGTVSEFCRIEGEDECFGFFVPDCIVWNEEKLRPYLADLYGDRPEEIQIELFDGYTTTANYMEV